MRYRRTTPLLAAASVATLLCGSCAPPARPAGGAIGDQVQQAIASGTESFDHAVWGDLLARGTRQGLVDYASFAEQRPALDAYLQRIAEAELHRLDRDQLMALLINAYNAFTIASILDHPGIASIRDIDGVWTERDHAVGGFGLTLDAIEHQLLRPYFKDPRIHVAVNCASISCAPLPPWAFDGARLDEQLEDLTRAFFADPKQTRVEGDELWVSQLLEWYGDDFVNPEYHPHAASLAEFIGRYAPTAVVELIERHRGHEGQPKIRFIEYDWALNEAQR
jgi:hypothetical protein